MGKKWNKPCRKDAPDHAGRIAFRLGRIEYRLEHRTAAWRLGVIGVNRLQTQPAFELETGLI